MNNFSFSVLDPVELKTRIRTRFEIKPKYAGTRKYETANFFGKLSNSKDCYFVCST